MKKGGTFALLCLTLAFAGFTVGMLVGRNFKKDSVTIEIPSSPEQTQTESLGETSEPFASDLININTASAKILDTLPGIGPVLAQRIVDYRQKNGPFLEISDLSKVEGIGAEKLLVLLDYITVEE